MACQPKFTNHARDQAALDKRFSVNVTMRGVIAAFMPIDFDGKPPGSEGRQAIYSVPVADRVSICANKVREGHASLILWERTELASWLYDIRSGAATGSSPLACRWPRATPLRPFSP